MTNGQAIDKDKTIVGLECQMLNEFYQASL
jgi:hypothetical protein